MTHENSPSLALYEEGLPDHLPDPNAGRRRFRLILYVVGSTVFILVVVNLWLSLVTAGTGMITGYVLDETGQPVTAEVIVVDQGIVVETDEEGYFLMSGIPSGQHTIVVGYLLAGVEREVTVSADQTTDIGIVEVTSREREDYPVARVDWR
jgi:hypothetical protein